jgi:CBS domain-containing protein
MTMVKHLLQRKGSEVWSIAPGAMVYEALQLMADKNVGALVVVEGGPLVGIMSERDYARKVILLNKSSMSVPVREIMTTKVFYVSPESSIEECMTIMTDKHIRHLPVLEEGQLVGVISIGDVVKAIISDREFIIEQLQNYIVGEGQPVAM